MVRTGKTSQGTCFEIITCLSTMQYQLLVSLISPLIDLSLPVYSGIPVPLKKTDYILEKKIGGGFFFTISHNRDHVHPLTCFIFKSRHTPREAAAPFVSDPASFRISPPGSGSGARIWLPWLPNAPACQMLWLATPNTGRNPSVVGTKSKGDLFEI